MLSPFARLHRVLPAFTLATALCGFVSVSSAQTAAPTPALTGNPLLDASPLPFGYPEFDKIKEEHFRPAFEAAMKEELAEIDAIAGNPAEPTFENTLVALDRAGTQRAKVDRILSNLVSTHSTPELKKIEKEMAPKLAAQKDTVRLNAALFARVSAIHAKRAELKLQPEDDRLVDRWYVDFVRAGAKLNDTDKARLRKINEEIATLQATFGQNVLNETNASAVLFDSRDELRGLSEAEITAAAAAAKNEKHEGKFLVRLMNTTSQPPLATLENRSARERLYKASIARGMRGGDYDNTGLVLRLAALRAERAKLLGYDNHAAYQLEEQTAERVEAVNKLTHQLAPAAVANARREAAEIQALIDQEKGGFQLAAWDWPFYSEKVRRARYNFDESELRPYFEMNRVLIDGVFYAATRLYGITFKERKDLPVYHPDVRVFDVFDADGQPLAIFLADLYARPSKRGGAWMNSYVPQTTLLGTKPVIANHLNVPKPPEGEPTLMTFDEVNTFFHEFGHALHGMFSQVTYPKFSGTAVPRDFVEFPSQVNEMWMTYPDVLRNFAKHHQTGALIPEELVKKIEAAEKFNQGYTTTEYLAAAILDQAWHQLSRDQIPTDVAAFEAAALKNAGVDFAPVPPRYRSTYFNHVFNLSYSAGYYSYIWSEVLDAASVDWFMQRGGLKRENGDRFRSTILSRGGSRDAKELFRAFYGSEPKIDPLLKRRGLDAK